MASSYCCISGCKTGPADIFALHKLPVNEERRRIWKHNIRKTKKGGEPSDYARVCSRHFVDGRPTEQNPFPVLDMGHDDVITSIGRKTETSKRAENSMRELHLDESVENVSSREEPIMNVAQPPEALVDGEPALADQLPQQPPADAEGEVVEGVVTRESAVETSPERRTPEPEEPSSLPIVWPYHPSTPKRRRLIETSTARSSMEDESQLMDDSAATVIAEK